MWSKIFTTVKYMLASINLLLLVAGIVVLAVGSSVQQAYNGYHSFLTDRFLSLPAFCIATGVIIFLIAFLGFYGAYSESYIMVMTYVGSMLVVFVFMFSACIAGYALKGNTVALVQQQLLETMQLYQTDPIVTRLWDEVQEDFKCCGVTGPEDWPKVLNNQETNQTQPDGLPIKCCLFSFGAVHQVNCTIGMSSVYKDGCADTFGNWVQGHIGSIAIAGIFLILLQATIVGGALWLANMMRQERGAYP